MLSADRLSSIAGCEARDLDMPRNIGRLHRRPGGGGTSGRHVPSFNPATGEEIGRMALASAAEVRQARRSQLESCGRLGEHYGASACAYSQQLPANS
jgi:hypothetical protein